MGPGLLVLVVGPSGAGKDTLIAGAKTALDGDPQVVFVRRHITRPADAGGEDHLAVTLEDFQQTLAAGGYALSWGAHGLRYGVPAAIAADLAAGRTAVVNASRAVVAEARDRFQPLRVLHVTAPPAVLAQRLAARGREDPADQAARVARAAADAPTGPDVREVLNDTTPEAGVARFLAALRG